MYIAGALTSTLSQCNQRNKINSESVTLLKLRRSVGQRQERDGRKDKQLHNDQGSEK